MFQENFVETNIWNVSIPVLENWVKSYKDPESNLKLTIETSSEILKRVPDLPNFMDKANYALQLIAEGKLNLNVSNNKGLEMEKIKLKSLRNNIIISILTIVIFNFISILII